VVITLWPKVELLRAPSSFSCGRKSLLRSAHVRVALVVMALAGLATRVKLMRSGASR
jgi:hypothetical protein